MRDHTPLPIASFRGTFDRGEDESCPIGYFRDSKNIRFLNRGVATRSGSSSVLNLANVVRIAVYKRIGEANRLLILDSSGRLYDSIDTAAPILTIATMTDFSMVPIFDRAYITPHNGITGLPGEKVYVYAGSGLARAAAGVAPTGFNLVAADSALSGNVEAGTRVFGVAYETASGYVTAPGGFVAFTSVGARKLDLSLISVGPAGTIARVLVCTKIIANFDGNFDNETYYFIPNGVINDNATTTLTVDFFDANLQADASYLLDQLSVIPAGVTIKLVAGRMVVAGEDANPEVVRVCNLAGEPESFAAADGFVTVNPGDSGAGVRNVCEYRGQLVMAKAQRFYATTITSDSPSVWKPIEISSNIGTECHGFARAQDFGETIEDMLFMVDRAGMRVFNGSFDQQGILTFSIQDQWDRINKAAFHTCEIALDPIKFLIYIAVPLDSATVPSHVFHGDYSEGLGKETIKWTTWQFPTAPKSIAMDVISSIPVLKFSQTDGSIYKLGVPETTDYLDHNSSIDSYIQFPLLPNDDAQDEQINHFTGCKLRIKGHGSLLVTYSDLDEVQTGSGETLTLVSAPGILPVSKFPLTSERCSVKLRTTGIVGFVGSNFNITKFILYIAPVWDERGTNV